ncbi:MAG: TIGR01212 family radical SAM protein [Pirellulales bacterium]|nr:TIGR01212 family radical SAM protein [Pirellulales bacterium]
MPGVSPLVPHYDWRGAGLRFYQYNYYLRQRFGQRVQKVSLDAKFTCPNVDGTVARGGCNFCDNRSFSPSRRQPKLSIADQLQEGIRRLKIRYKADRFLAYFQPATNTYAPVERLRPLYESALTDPRVVGMAIGTRPDCVPDDVLDLLAEFAGKIYLSVEYGMQTMHDRSLTWMNRGQNHAAMIDAMTRSQGRGFEICAHIILGIPGESPADMLATAREAARLGVNAVKLHNLYVVKNTALEEEYLSGKLKLLSREEYLRTVVDVLEALPPGCLVERISGEAPPEYFLGPAWALDKPALRAALQQEFERRNTWQGAKYQPC